MMNKEHGRNDRNIVLSDRNHFLLSSSCFFFYQKFEERFLRKYSLFKHHAASRMKSRVTTDR